MEGSSFYMSCNIKGIYRKKKNVLFKLVQWNFKPLHMFSVDKTTNSIFNISENLCQIFLSLSCNLDFWSSCGERVCSFPLTLQLMLVQCKMRCTSGGIVLWGKRSENVNCSFSSSNENTLGNYAPTEQQNKYVIISVLLNVSMLFLITLGFCNVFVIFLIMSQKTQILCFSYSFDSTNKNKHLELKKPHKKDFWTKYNKINTSPLMFDFVMNSVCADSLWMLEKKKALSA